jgi:dynactin complex subunit
VNDRPESYRLLEEHADVLRVKVALQEAEIERLTERNGKLAAQVGEQVGEIERVKAVLTAEITAHLQTIERLRAALERIARGDVVGMYDAIAREALK